MGKATYKGKYAPINPEKYIGDSNNIIFRSLWERQVMMYLDKNANVLKWGSEEIKIPYISPKDNEIHHYYPDFVVEYKSKDGDVCRMLMEIKPTKDITPPSSKRRHTKYFLQEQMVYDINMAKFEAAMGFCKARDWEFRIVTEKDIFGK